MEKILVVGATGSVGFEVAKLLNDLNKPVKIAVRDPERAKSINLKNAKLVHFEYQSPDTFDSAFDDVEKLLIVSPPSYLNLQELVKNAVDAAIAKGVKQIVNISALSAESELDRPIKVIEEHIKNSGVDFVILRPNFYMQNFKDLFRNLIIEDNQISAPTSNAKTSFIDIRDVAQVAVKALTENNLNKQTIKLTGKQSLNMHVVAHLFSEVLKREIEYNDISEEQFEKSLRSAGWPKGTIIGTLQLCSHVKKGETALITDSVERILNREPIKFDQFIVDYSDNWE
jgi:uncharacterized protein YbjT (DUF2867 family)